MRVIINLILVFFILESCKTQNNTNSTVNSTSNCGPGCLACSSTGNCLVCDFKQKMFLINKVCTSVTFPGCRYMNSDGSCASCGPSMVSTQTNCQLINSTTAGIIQNCLYFGNNPNICLQCSSGYYLSTGLCALTKLNVTNCLAYSADGVYCTSCDSGYYPSSDFTQCTSLNIASIPGCQKYGFMNCGTCANPYRIDQNIIYFTFGFQSSVFNQNQMVFLQSLDQKDNTLNYYTRCSNYQIPNCQTAVSLTNCTVCNPGYINSADGSCQPFPQSSISNCLIYTSPTSCATCASNYWKQSITNCAPVIPIQNCVQYNPLYQSICILCDVVYYLQNNLCFSRMTSLSISNCLEIFIDRDMCQICNQGYVLNIDFSQCLPNLFNCNQTMFIQNTLICISCNPGFYLSLGSCIQGSIANCNLYQNATVCLSCQVNFYLASNQSACLSHNLMNQVSCQTFSTITQNYCLGCSPTRIGFNLANICLSVQTLIPNCVSYSSATTCAVCNSTVSYLQNNICVTGTITGCINYAPTKNQCTNCWIDPNTKIVFQLNGNTVNNACVSGNQNPYNNCQQISTDVSKTCSTCSQGNFQYLITSPTIRYCVSVLSTFFPANPNIQNCNVYDHINNVCLQCVQNGDGSFNVILNGQCFSQCSSGMSPQAFVISNNQVQKMFVCQPNNFFVPSTFTIQFNIACPVFDMDMLSNWSCANCNNDFVGVFDLTISANNAMYYSYLLTTSFGVYYNRYNRITIFKGCLSNKNALTNSATGTVVSPTMTSTNQASVDLRFCRFLIQLGASINYGCQQCAIGFSAVVGQAVSSTQYIVDNCVPVPFCQSDVWINALVWNPASAIPYPLDFYVSCHSCSKINNAVQIPTFGFSTAAITSISPNVNANFIGPFGIPGSLDLNTSPFQVSAVNFIYQTTCQTPGLTQSATFIQNCGIQAILIDKVMRGYSNGLVTGSTNPVCVVCNPMFAPTYSTVLIIAVQSCVLIPNCAYSNMFNYCEICANGFAMLSTALYTSCIATDISNCFLSNASGVCQLCVQGYVLDPDGNCAVVNPLRCSSSNSGFYQPPQTLNLMYQYYMKGAGCTLCDSGNIAVYFSSAQPLCVNSHIILSSNNQSFKATKVYIPYCQYYGLDSNFNIICKGCLSGYILGQSNAGCFLLKSASLQYCAVAQNSGLLCSQCISGYFFDTVSQTCLTGKIQNCVSYLNQNTCLSCATGFLVSQTLSGTSICFDGTLMNCVNIDQSQSISGTLSCLTCANGFFATSNTFYGNFPLKQCLPIPPIQNCVSYSTQSLITLSRLSCLSCASGFYLSSTLNQCVKRINSVVNCVSYSPNADLCSNCAIGFYLLSSGIACVANPTGINFCITYLDTKTCITCAAGMYLWLNQCLPVLAANLIPNCLYYKSYFECSQCQANFFLTLNFCQIAVASNCLTYTDKNTCASCSAGMGLSPTLNIISCVPLIVANCDVPDSNTLGPNFGCLQCSTSYYYSAGQCLQVQSTIPNCKYYINGTNCLSCYGIYIVSFDQLSCTNSQYLTAFADPNCSASYLNLTCQLCTLGFYLQKGICIACPTNSTVCLQCNPYNLSSCLLCQYGYYQVENGSCIFTKAISGPVVVVNGTNFTTNSTSVSHENRMNGLVLVFAFFIFAFRLKFEALV